MATESLIGRKARCPACDELVEIKRPKEWSTTDMLTETQTSDDEIVDLLPAVSPKPKSAPEPAADAPKSEVAEARPQLARPLDEQPLPSQQAAKAAKASPKPKSKSKSKTDGRPTGSTTVTDFAPVTAPEPEPPPRQDGKKWKGGPKPKKQPVAVTPVEADADGDGPVEPSVSFGDRARPESDMDMTPMVDVTFLLLIFFMVTASFTMQKAMDIPQQEENEPSENFNTIDDFLEDPENVLVQIDSNNTYHILTAEWEEEAPNEHDMRQTLRRAREANSQGKAAKRMLVVVHADALYEKVVAALDAGTDVGIPERMVSMTEDEFE